VKDDAGNVARLVGTVEDVTDRRQLEDQVRQSQKLEAIGQLAGGVAHDFNNILTVIQGYGSLLLAEDISDEAANAVEQVLLATNRAANLTRQLLTFGRRQVMQPGSVDLNDIVGGLAKMLQRILGEDVHLEVRLHPTPLFARADAGMLDQVLMNLVVNARDAMPDGGQLVIDTTTRRFGRDDSPSVHSLAPGPYVGFVVQDTGIGIRPADVSRLFEPFYTTKTRSEGMGLGLATVLGIVKQHAGVVNVESTPGSGTAFSVFLPAEPAGDAERSAKAPTREPRRGQETILLVEDEAVVRSLTRLVLERQGYRVLEAGDGVEALRVWGANQGRIRLLLTDIVLPAGVGGRQLAARLRALDPSLRVVFMSGYSAEIAGRELTLEEGRNFVQKPYSPPKLLEAVERCLDA
jgi:nitrogen-specific signal transduction histidine kinase